MRILITGAAGFLGSHLCDHLLKPMDMNVIGMDNFITGSPDNIAHLAGNEIVLNFTNVMFQIISFVPGKVDAILHFASPASPNPQSKSGYFNLPIQTMKAGALGTHNCLGIARAHNARFLLASTSEIYGDPEVHPQTETYAGNVDPVGTRAVYDEAKRFAESLTMAYHRFHNVNTSIVRIFNTYGPRMDLEDGRALPNLLKQALLGQPLTVYGDGQADPLLLLCR
jgi:dTDP-glucose 4,6-dehydratase